MEINGIKIVERLIIDRDQSIVLEPIMYEKDLLIPVGLCGTPKYFKIPGKLIKELVDANTSHANKV